MDPSDVLRSNFASLAEVTTDPLWLANRLFSGGILSNHIRKELETSNMPTYNKATKLWSEILTAVKHQGNPTQTLLTVCHVMKKRQELAHIANSVISQLGGTSIGENRDHESSHDFISVQVYM